MCRMSWDAEDLVDGPVPKWFQIADRLRRAIAGGDDGTFTPIDPAPERETTFTIGCSSRLPSVLRLPVAAPGDGPLFAGE